MNAKRLKRAPALFCALVLLAGCPNPTEDNGGDSAVSFVGAYGVAHPNDTGSRTNYLVLAVGSWDYTKGTYKLNGTTATPSPVLTDSGRTTLIKVPVGTGTTYALTVTEGETSLLNKSGTFDAAGTNAPGVLYGDIAMTFSEFFHDITANITEVKPTNKAFVRTGSVAEPEKFINAGTRTGNNSAGTANQTSKWTETDSQAKVDVISSATYGDNPHFVPTGNLAINYENPMTKADGNAVTGIKAVDVGVDFDLYANADLLKQAEKAVPQSTEVLAKAGEITWKASTEVYKAKYLRPDVSWGRRDETAINEDKGKAWPKAIGGTDGAKVTPTYGGTWADKVISVDFAPLPSTLTSADLWNNYFDYVYAGYVEDMQTNHKEPLVWLQNLFSHRGHTNLEAAIQRAGFSRMDKLSPAGTMRVVIFAQGFKDIVAETAVAVYDGQSSASIEQGSAFYVSGTDSSAIFQNSEGASLAKELHVTGLSEAALADFAAKGGTLSKGGTAVPGTACELAYEEEDGEVAIKLKDAFFTGSFQGTYSFNITSDTQYKAITFTVNRIITRPQLKQGTGGTSSNADTANNAITVTKTGGNISFDNDEFAKAIATTGRGPSSITTSPMPTADRPAITTVLKQTGGVYYIDAEALSAGDWTISIQAPNFVDTNRRSIVPVVYYIKVQ
jgi:hypothetical protein